jgi:hypothetical protein
VQHARQLAENLKLNSQGIATKPFDFNPRGMLATLAIATRSRWFMESGYRVSSLGFFGGEFIWQNCRRSAANWKWPLAGPVTFPFRRSLFNSDYQTNHRWMQAVNAQKLNDKYKEPS